MGAVVQGFGQVLGGNAQASADQERALELRQQAGLVKVQAQEQSATLLTKLQNTVGAISALTASRGGSIDSPSAQAIVGQRTKTALTDVQTTGANAAMQAGMLSESAQAAIMAGQNAQMNSWFQAIGTVDNAASRVIGGMG
jgi:hypothetical protein